MKYHVGRARYRGRSRWMHHMPTLAAVSVVIVALTDASLVGGTTVAAAPTASEPVKRSLTTEEILAASGPSDWRSLDPQHTVYLELGTGRVVIEFIPQFAPRNVANVEALSRGNYYDGLPIFRVQDNYVVEWGDAGRRKPVGVGQRTAGAEFERPLRGVSITRLADPDT